MKTMVAAVGTPVFVDIGRCRAIAGGIINRDCAAHAVGTNDGNDRVAPDHIFIHAVSGGTKADD